MNRLATIGETAEVLGVSISTLRRWDKEGRLEPERTASGHRRYDISKLKPVLFSGRNAKYKAAGKHRGLSLAGQAAWKEGKMSTPKEIEKEQADRLHELLQIKQEIKKHGSLKTLNMAITRAKATMAKESIAWVEKNVAEMEDE